MTGDAPQPGETPRSEANPWSFDPNGAWWRTDRDRDRNSETGAALTEASPFLGEAVDAHAAGVHDAAEAFTETIEPVFPKDEDDPERREEAETSAWLEALRDEPAAREPDGLDEADDLPDLIGRAGGVPEVMILGESDRDRPTIALDRSAVPGQSAGVSRLGQARPGDDPGPRTEAARLRMENSPFWLSEEERAAAGAAWPGPGVRADLSDPGPADGRRGLPPLQAPRAPRPPAAGLLGLVALSLIAAFFSWVSAEPFWLAVGHSDRGLATVTQCTGSGVTQRCVGSFAATDGSFGVPLVPLLGVDPAHRASGTVAVARMVSPQSRQAYVGANGTLVHLRWLLGFLLVLLCGFGITALTGTRQLESLRARRTGLLLSLAGPALLLTGFLYATY